MTQILPATSARSREPRTHALVIGVGDYPYLRGGREYLAQDGGRVTLGLAQLTSPPLSAAAFAAWLVHEYRNADAPLGSVELLLSPSPPAREHQPSWAVERATMARIKQAFDRWYARCDRNTENVAIFYFCGHGLERGSTLLLAEDFGKQPNRLWESCFDLDLTWYGMGECAATTQLYFVDACRETPLELLQAHGARPAPLKETLKNRFPDRVAPILKAAPIGHRAHGPVDGVSYFTQGLLRCLRELGADRFDGAAWVVSIDSLCSAMKIVMQRTRLADGRRCACSIGGESSSTVDIHEIRGGAKVMAEIGCRPSKALGTANLSLSDGVNPPQVRPLAATEPWEVEVPPGTYEIRATFAGRRYRDAVDQVLVLPPYHPHHLRVEP